MAGKLLSDGWKALSVVAGKAIPGCWNTCAAGKLLPEKRKGFDRPEKKGLAEAFVFPDDANALFRLESSVSVCRSGQCTYRTLFSGEDVPFACDDGKSFPAVRKEFPGRATSGFCSRSKHNTL